MKQNGRIKILIAMLLCLLVMGLCAVAGAASSGTCGDNLTWTLDDEGLLTISGTGEMTSNPWDKDAVKTISIEDGVTSISGAAFLWCHNLTTITIPDSVTQIAGGVFIECENLKNVVFPKNATINGEAVFSGCTGLTSVTLPDNMTSIGAEFFFNCTNLASITIPDSVTSIGEMAFNDCASLTSINLPDGLTSIGLDAFAGCGFTSITIPKGVTNFGNRAFAACTDLQVANVEAESNNIPFANAFGDCSSLTSVNIPADNPTYCSVDGVVFNKNKTALIFYPAGKTSSYSIPESVTSIGADAFKYCSGLTSITIPKSVTDFGNIPFTSLFEGCSSLTSVNIPADHPTYCSVDGVVFNKNKTALIFYPAGRTGSYSIPESVTSIGDYAFNGCSGLTGITIPDGVTSIGDCAFFECTGLKSARLSVNISNLGESAFDKATTLIVPEGSYAAQWAVEYELKYETYDPTPKSIVMTTDGHGTASASPSSGVEGTEVTLAATPDEGYRFKEWQVVSGGVTITGGKFTIGTSDIEIKAIFEPITYTVTITDDGNGKASASPSAGVKGTEVTLAATPDEGYQFKEWQVVSGGVTVTGSKFTVGTSDVEIKAIFEKAEVPPAVYSVSVTTDGHGTASASPSSGVKGTEVTLAATPDEGYRFKEWQVVSGGVSITDNKFTIGASNVEIKAVFEPVTYTVTITNDGNGKASASPSSGAEGTQVTLAATPKAGYKFKEWVVVSGDVTIQENRFTIGSSNVEIQAAFELLTIGDTFVSGGMKYQILTDKTVSFLGLEKAKSKTSVSIPATVNFGKKKTYKVTEIAAKAMYKDTKVKTVTIGKFVETIGKSAFYGAKALATVKGGNVVTGIGGSAFASCVKLKTFPALTKLKTIGANALKGCKALTKFTIGNKVTKIGRNAFNGCTKLKTWTVKSKKLTKDNIGAGAFKNIAEKASFKCPSEKLAKSYETIFKKAGAPKSAKFTK